MPRKKNGIGAKGEQGFAPFEGMNPPTHDQILALRSVAPPLARTWKELAQLNTLEDPNLLRRTKRQADTPAKISNAAKILLSPGDQCRYVADLVERASLFWEATIPPVSSGFTLREAILTARKFLDPNGTFSLSVMERDSWANRWREMARWADTRADRERRDPTWYNRHQVASYVGHMARFMFFLPSPDPSFSNGPVSEALYWINFLQEGILPPSQYLDPILGESLYPEEQRVALDRLREYWQEIVASLSYPGLQALLVEYLRGK